MEIRCLVILSCFLPLTTSRGPHHPRGDKVIKHHVHYRPTKEAAQKLTEDVELLHDTEHLQEHLEEIIPEPDFANMTDDELEFYYFQVHDSDKNSKLDGLEILQALIHINEHEYMEENENEIPSAKLDPQIEYYVELIDQVLLEDDTDQDGYLSYSEYVTGRRQSKLKEMKKTPSVTMV